ncbi:uncharacterized protein YecE (DUF72 family) [Saccharothrix ecbatanensis]|uniref:Uncharacterized protein YecE (DUF72 family) n=1 Tax=Saccharothrix ecbatanensis TaxID=1105145 RepID=A0A7W9HVC8_9PSEU|nr:DUF72 domain-containing protein [Saccharothrix ecbatanensis]MBB5808689.1 uncharacterized protein YecE (DUF72 family) [Saccharothrix ecbatanensis]
MTGRVRIGTSGWVYPTWRGAFYPKGLVQRRELEHISGLMTSVELNGSFYSLQRPSSYRAWAAQTPEDFVFAVKGGRFITHMKQLRDVEAPLANFFASGVLALGPKLGPFLWQLPAKLAYDRDRLTAFFRLLPRTTSAAAELAERHDDRLSPERAWTITDADRPLRHALEVRHPTYSDSEFHDLLRAHDIALVVSHSAGVFPYLEDVTADFAYVRLHGNSALYVGSYTDAELDEWAVKIGDWAADHDVYVYFDNDTDAVAPHDAIRLAERLRPALPKPGPAHTIR